MQGRAQVRGIERKILRSILFVGIVPLAIAVVGALYLAREGKAAAVRETLRIAAEKTAQGLEFFATARLDYIERLARDVRIVSALSPREDGRPTVEASGEALADLRNYLFRQVSEEDAENSSSTLLLLDAAGKVVLKAGNATPDLERPNWAGTLENAQFVDFMLAGRQMAPLAQTAAPVRRTEIDREVVGYVSELFDITKVLKFALGGDEPDDSKERPETYYLAFQMGEEMRLLRLDPAAAVGAASLVRDQLVPDVSKALLGADRSGTERLTKLEASQPAQARFVGYARLFRDYPAFILISRTEASVFGPIYLQAAGAAALVVTLIAFLCLNAYRNVHNNIVRPVMLLNEGAQIIGQGDLELKLKIGTGDEIEELAVSFNKMALALKRNIRRLEESEEKYRTLVTSMRDGIFQIDREGVIGFLNPAGVEILGFADRDDALGKNIRDMFMEPADLSAFTEELEKSGFVERSRVWIQRQDGRAICVELSGNVVHDDDGAAAGVEGIFRDVTKSIRLERDARDRAERLAVINQIANVINSSLEVGRLYESLVVEIRKLVDFNYAELALLTEKGDAFETRQLWPEHEAAPGRLRGLDDESSCSAWVARRSECLLVGNLTVPDCAFAGQFPRDIKSCLCVPLYAQGRIIGTLNLGADRFDAFTHHDVEVLEQVAPHVAVAIRNAHLLVNLQQSLEEVTLAREKLYNANEELKTLDEMKTNLLSNVSHELRTPLVAVMGYTDMIINEKAGPINEEQREYLEISLRNIEKLVTLIENLLDFSRLHRGAETLAFDTFDLTDCARASMQIMQPVAQARDITMELIAPNEPVLVEGDKGKLGQVFNNLLSNAVKFNRTGGRVTIEFTMTDGEVRVAVQDTGIGIPEEALDKVFTRFYQYDSSSTRKYGGTGIGLSIAQDIARLHGTRITVTSELGKGSTFRFSLPLRKQREAADMAADEPVAAGTRLLIELVTRDRALSTQVRNLLASEGMDVIHAMNAAQAIGLAQRHSPNCIIVDTEGAPAGQPSPLLDKLLADRTAGQLPIILMTNEDAIYERYRPLVASRVKRNFRKSALLSGIQYAVGLAAGVGETTGHRILCVDDDPEVLTFMQRCLEKEGYDVTACTSGAEAVERVGTGEFGLVLLDLAMPDLDGWETCRRIKTDLGLKHVKVIIVTAKPVDSSSQRFREEGADGYLLKPFRAEDLLEVVHGLPVLRVTKEA